MSLIQTLPEIKADFRLKSADFDLRSDALQRWQPDVRAAAEDDNTITIYEPIGYDYWSGEGVTAKRISAALRAIGDKDVVVNINSPGGNLFEGMTIYNMFRNHKAKVTVQVLGLAASAASVIAMAGDDILMGDGAFLMIHNASVVAIGNRHDMQDAVDRLESIDDAMAGVYAARSGISKTDAAAMMDKETWLNAETAVKDGFATGYLESSLIATEAQSSASRKPLAAVEAALAQAGYSRSARRDLLAGLFNGSKPGAAAGVMPGADAEIAASLQNLMQIMKGN